MKQKLFILLFLILEIYLLSYSNIIIKDFNNTLNICLYNLMPTMFFSILFTNILINLNIQDYIPLFLINFLKKFLI